MADDRIGTYGKPMPKLTIGGFARGYQWRLIVGIGNHQFVIVGHNDVGYEDEIAKLRAGNTRQQSKPPKHIKREAVNEQPAETESDS